MNPNPGMYSNTLVGVFDINGFDTRKIWYDNRCQKYIVTDNYGLKPKELLDNTFENKELIIMIYNALRYNIYIENIDSNIKPNWYFI